MLADLGAQIVVHNIFKVDLVEIVGPWVEDGEALVLDFLVAVLHDVLLDELEVSFVGRDGVGQVILINVLLGVPNERSNSLDARLRLKVLALYLGVNGCGDAIVACEAKSLEHTDEYLFETLKVPVLVDAGVDDSAGEDLLGLAGEQVAQVVHLVNFIVRGGVARHELGYNLLGDHLEGTSKSLGQHFVLLGILDGSLDLVHQGAHCGHDEWLDYFFRHFISNPGFAN